MNVRQMLRDPRNFVAGRLVNFLDLAELPQFLRDGLPDKFREKWSCVLKADAADFIVSEPVPEYLGMPPELAGDIRAKKRFLSVGAQSDMPGLHPHVDLVVHFRVGTANERIAEILDQLRSHPDVHSMEQPFADAVSDEFRRVVYVRAAKGPTGQIISALRSHQEVARITEMLVRWRGKMMPAVALTVVKTGENTWSVVDAIAKFLSRVLGRRIHHSQILTSGLKDKRAWTVQMVVVVGVSMADLVGVTWPTWNDVNAHGRGYFVKDVRATNRLISQGDHAWNGFVIRARVEGKTAAELEEYMGLYAMALKLKGDHIPDGFHLQRLGPGQDMMLFGETLITGDYVPQPDADAQAQLVAAVQDLREVTVLHGDFGYIDGDALIAPMDHRGELSYQVNGVVTRAAGKRFHEQLGGRKLAPGETFVATTTTAHNGTFGDVVFVGDACGQSMSTMVYRALEAAEDAGYKTVVVPVVRMRENGTISRYADALRKFYSDKPRVMSVKLVGYAETDPFASNVEAMLHRFCTDPSPRDNPQVRAMKAELRRKWFMYFEDAEEALRRVYRRSGYNMSLEYEVLKRYADYDPCETCGKGLPERAQSCPNCGRQQRAGHRFNGCAEAVLYDLRDRLSLGYGAIQGFFANHEIARQIELGLSKPGDNQRIPLPMSCDESRELYSQSEIGREAVRMLAVTETLAAPAEAYFDQFVSAYWAAVSAERRSLEEQLEQHDDLYRRLHSTLRGQDADRLDRLRDTLRRKGERVKAPSGSGRVDTVVALLTLEETLDSLRDQIDALDVPDADTGLSFRLVKRLFMFNRNEAPTGVTAPRPSHESLSAAFVKFMYLTPRDRKTGVQRSRPPRRNVFAGLQGLSYECADGVVTMRFALPRGSYATMKVALDFNTADTRQALPAMDCSESGDSDN